MNEEEALIEANAFNYIKANSGLLIRKFAPINSCHDVAKPVSLFMAGSPGAGKTEVSRSFAKQFRDMPIRIDADDIRPMCDGYIGTNAHLFQKAANKGVNILYDHALENGINCILDGTFAYGNVSENIQRSLKRKRIVQIWFVYQDPEKAWEFTKVREQKESRRVSKNVFIRAFTKARENVTAVKAEFSMDVKLNLLVKDYSDDTEELHLNITGDELDRLTRGVYPIEELHKILV